MFSNIFATVYRVSKERSFLLSPQMKEVWTKWKHQAGRQAGGRQTNKTSVLDPYSLNPYPYVDTAKNLNPDPDPDPEDPWIVFWHYLELVRNYFLIIKISYQKKSIERYKLFEK